MGVIFVILMNVYNLYMEISARKKYGHIRAIRGTLQHEHDL